MKNLLFSWYNSIVELIGGVIVSQDLIVKKKEFIEPVDVLLNKIKERKVSFRSIPKKIRTYEMCLEAVKINPFNLKEVPENFLTEELCFAAVEISRSDRIRIRFSIHIENKQSEKQCHRGNDRKELA